MRHKNPWRISFETPEDLHRALFYRDALRIPVLERLGHLRIPPPRPPGINLDDPAELAGDWAAWWTDLFLRRRTPASTPQDRLTTRVPDTARLREIVHEHEPDFHHWWATYPPTPNSGQKTDLASTITTSLAEHHPEGDLLAEQGHDTPLTIDVLALDAPFTRAVTPHHIVITEPARHQPTYPDWLTTVLT